MGVSGRRKEKTQCRSTQVKHETTAFDQTSGIDLSRGPCDHFPMREVDVGIWPRKKLATLTYFYLLILAS